MMRGGHRIHAQHAFVGMLVFFGGHVPPQRQKQIHVAIKDLIDPRTACPQPATVAPPDVQGMYLPISTAGWNP